MLKFEKNTNTQIHSTEIVNKKISEITVHDIGKLIDIVSKLQYINHDKLAIPILYELDTLLEVEGSVLGIYDPESVKNDYIVATIAKELIPEFNRYSHLEMRNSPGYFENQGGKFRSFLYLKCKNNILQLRQRHIIKIILPYLFSSTIRLYLISRKHMVFGLTSRELEVMEWIIAGKDNWSISKILGVSERTIKFHNCNIYRKLGVNTKAEAISLYLGNNSCNVHLM